MKISPARTAAFDVLMRIEAERAFSSVLLSVYEERLSPRDRGLCHEITLGVLRRQIFLDRAIDQFSGKKLDVAVRIALRIGLYQLLFLSKIPQHSAINESVNLVQRAKKTSANGIVNAVLRRATREEVTLEFVDDVDRVSVETSHPWWLVEKWISEFGAEAGERIAAANNEVPVTAFRVTGKFERGDFALGARESQFVGGCFIAETTNESLRAAAARGEIYFQDEGSQMVAAAVKVPEGGRFLDVCAAPGGKTGQIAMREIVGDEENHPGGSGHPSLVVRGAKSEMFVAGDLYWKRAVFLKENCERQRVAFVNVVQHDAENGLPFEDGTFDAALVDAPCSGTGTIRHNPELRYFIKPGDFAELSRKQLTILKNASKVVKPGGMLVYSTCSFEKEENEAVCEAFLGEEFERVRPDVPERFLTEEGFARTFPDRDGMDGFFVAAFRKR